jgi:hypothetical protein
MPGITGHAKLFEEYLADTRAEYHATANNEDASDPDWKVNQCYILLVAAALEMEDGAENLWKSGRATG